MVERRMTIGAEVQAAGGVHFRVWAPKRRSISVVLPAAADGSRPEALLELSAEGNGFFSGLAPNVAAGDLYWFRIDGSDPNCPDPASRFQPAGPHGPSQVIDPAAFRWTDDAWRGCTSRGSVIYEMHVGTFTSAGTWDAAAQELPELAECGINVIELMPVADFPGRFGWGYDGVNFFAPTRLYGSPDDFRAFVDRAHSVGIGVILDVVYNHVGPDGNYLRNFCDDYFSKRYKTDWGEGINFDGENSGPVRDFYESNAAYFIREFHLDGLRLDATQDIHDDSDEHILTTLTRRTREAAGNRSVFVVAENEPQDTRLVRPVEEGGHGIDCLWNDDFHHSAMVVLTGHNEAYYTDYLGRAQEFISAVKRGYLYQGQRYLWQKKRRGTPSLDLSPTNFVTYIQNHDQIANSGLGLRCHRLSSSGRCRAMTALMLLGPQTPMLFQGQEFASSSPFFYFADHREDLAKLVHEGRKNFMSQFRSVAVPEIQSRLPDPADPMTFVRSKLDFTDRQRNADCYNLHRDLLKLRRDDAVFSRQEEGAVDGAVINDETFLLRFFAEDGDDRLILVNFGRDIHYSPAPEPLLAPPRGKNGWSVLWSSEDPRYGGSGTALPETTDAGWRIPGHAAVVLRGTIEFMEDPARKSDEKE